MINFFKTKTTMRILLDRHPVPNDKINAKNSSINYYSHADNSIFNITYINK